MKRLCMRLVEVFHEVESVVTAVMLLLWLVAEGRENFKMESTEQVKYGIMKRRRLVIASSYQLTVKTPIVNLHNFILDVRT